MAVTQYIGARYVPNFASPIEWNNTRTYDPLTIVTHQGNSYTSRQFVPQGVNIANDTFWALTGNYNAQIEQYRQEVANLSAEMAEKFATVNAGIDDIRSKMYFKSIEEYGCSESLTDNSDNFQQALNDAAGKYVLLIPAKQYNFTNEVVIPWNTNIMGVSRHGSILYFDGCNGFVCGTDINGYKTCVGTHLSRFTIRGNYSYKFTQQPSTPAIRGIYGWFTNSLIEQINVDHFWRGIETYVPPFAGSDYNQKYNNVYGDMRTWNNICVEWCLYGIFAGAYDSYFNTVSLAHMGYEAARFSGSHIANLHAWDVPYIYLLDGCMATSIEIESVNPRYNVNVPGFDVFESPVVANPGAQGIEISGCRIWNIDTSTEYTGFNHPYIRCENGSTGALTITGLLIGRQADGSNTPPKQLFHSHGAKSCFIQGAVSRSLTTPRSEDSPFISSHMGGVLINLSGNTSLSPHLNDYTVPYNVSATVI